MTRRSRKDHGFTITEIVVALGLLSIVGAIVLAAILATQRTSRIQERSVTSQASLIDSVTRMTRDISMANPIVAANETTITTQDMRGDTCVRTTYTATDDDTLTIATRTFTDTACPDRDATTGTTSEQTLITGLVDTPGKPVFSYFDRNDQPLQVALTGAGADNVAAIARVAMALSANVEERDTPVTLETSAVPHLLRPGTVNNPTSDALAAPRLSKTASGGDIEDLTWSDVAGSTGYWLLRNGSSLAQFTSRPASYTDSTLAPGETAYYQVFALNGRGLGPGSNVVTLTAPVNGPELTGTANQATLENELSWTVPAGTDSFDLLRVDPTDPAIVLSTAAAGLPNTTSTFNDPRPAGSTTTYKVVAHRGASESDSNAVTLTLRPAAPALTCPTTGESTPPNTYTTVEQTPTVAAQTGAVAYRVERVADGQVVYPASGSSMGTPLPGGEQQSHGWGTRTSYRAFASNAGGDSPAATIDCITRPAPPSASLSLIGVNQVAVTWPTVTTVDPASARSYRVWMKVNSGSWTDMGSVFEHNFAAAGRSFVLRDGSGNPRTFANNDFVAVEVYAYSPAADTAVQRSNNPGVRCDGGVCPAVMNNARGYSDAGDGASVTLAPDAPTATPRAGLHNGRAMMVVSVQDIPGATSYNVYRNGVLLGSVPDNGTHTARYRDTNGGGYLMGNTSYSYTAQSVNSLGQTSAQGSSASASTLPDTPSNVRAIPMYRSEPGNSVTPPATETYCSAANDASVAPARFDVDAADYTGGTLGTNITTADGSITPSVDDAIDVNGRYLFVAGEYSTATGANSTSQSQGANAITKWDTETGRVMTAFRFTANNKIESITADPGGQYLYVGGAFTSVTGNGAASVTRRYIAKINATSGAVISGFNSSSSTAGPNNTVRAMEFDHTRNRLIVAGHFTTWTQPSGGGTRNRFTAVDPTTGQALSTALQGNPTFNDHLWKLEVTSDGRYFTAGPSFTTASGNPLRSRISEVLTNGTVRDPGFDLTRSGVAGLVMDMDSNPTDPSVLYVGVAQSSGNTPDMARAFNITTGATIWERHIGHDVQTVAVQDDRVYITFHNGTNAGSNTYRIFALQTTDGTVDTTFRPIFPAAATNSPDFWGPTKSVVTPYGYGVWGSITSIGGETHNRVAWFPRANASSCPVGTMPAIDHATTPITGTSLAASSGQARAHAITQYNGTAYVAGRISQATTGSTTVTTRGIAAFDMATGIAVPFRVELLGGSGAAVDLSEYDGKMHVVGDFTDVRFTAADGTVTNHANHGYAVLDLDDAGRPLPVATAFDVAVSVPFTVAASAGGVYIGGDFTNYAGTGRNHLIKVTADTGALDTTFASPTYTAAPGDSTELRTVTEVEVSPSGVVYTAGEFHTVNGQWRPNVAAFNPTEGSLAAVQPNAGGGGADGAFELDFDATGATVFIGMSGDVSGGDNSDQALAIDTATGAVKWRLFLSSAAHSIEEYNGKVYIGHHYDYRDDYTRRLLVAEAVTGRVYRNFVPTVPLSPQDASNYAVDAISVSNAGLVIGGTWTAMNGDSSVRNIAFFPTNALGGARDTDQRITWTAPAGGASEYLVLRDGVVKARTANTSWTWADNFDGGQADIQVVAVNATGSSPATPALPVATRVQSRVTGYAAYASGARWIGWSNLPGAARHSNSLLINGYAGVCLDPDRANGADGEIGWTRTWSADAATSQVTDTYKSIGSSGSSWTTSELAQASYLLGKYGDYDKQGAIDDWWYNHDIWQNHVQYRTTRSRSGINGALQWWTWTHAPDPTDTALINEIDNDTDALQAAHNNATDNTWVVGWKFLQRLDDETADAGVYTVQVDGWDTAIPVDSVRNVTVRVLTAAGNPVARQPVMVNVDSAASAALTTQPVRRTNSDGEVAIPVRPDNTDPSLTLRVSLPGTPYFVYGTGGQRYTALDFGFTVWDVNQRQLRSGVTSTMEDTHVTATSAAAAADTALVDADGVPVTLNMEDFDTASNLRYYPEWAPDSQADDGWYLDTFRQWFDGVSRNRGRLTYEGVDFGKAGTLTQVTVRYRGDVAGALNIRLNRFDANVIASVPLTASGGSGMGPWRTATATFTTPVSGRPQVWVNPYSSALGMNDTEYGTTRWQFDTIRFHN